MHSDQRYSATQLPSLALHAPQKRHAEAQSLSTIFGGPQYDAIIQPSLPIIFT
jgi:hypothetical protein